MDANDPLAQIDALVAKLASVGWRERDAVKEQLLAVARANPTEAVERHLEGSKKGLNNLELRWEIDEVLEGMKPEPEPEPEPEEEVEQEPEAAPDGQLRMSDLVEVYADPRGLALYTDKTGARWFASQPHPMSGQPMMMELSAGEIAQVRQQLAGSPYWNIGSGVAS